MRLAEHNVPKKKWTVGSAKNRPLTPSPIANPRALLHPSIVATPPPPKPYTPPQTNTLAECFPYLTLYTWRRKNNIPYHCTSLFPALSNDQHNCGTSFLALFIRVMFCMWSLWPARDFAINCFGLVPFIIIVVGCLSFLIVVLGYNWYLHLTDFIITYSHITKTSDSWCYVLLIIEPRLFSSSSSQWIFLAAECILILALMTLVALKAPACNGGAEQNNLKFL